jgi:proteasome accessory factor C
MAIVPWVVEQGGASIEELCERFDVSEKELVEDLERFSMTGVHPYTPDAMNELLITDDWVSIDVGPWFRRPLSLTHDQAVGVLAAASALASTPGASPDGALARALEKVRAVLARGAEDSLSVDLGRADADVLDALRRAIAARRAVRIEYYSAGRDTQGTRVVEPVELTTRDGAWYLAAWCRAADAARSFRVDRISSIEVLDEEVPERSAGRHEWFADAEELPRVTLRVRPPGRVLLEHVPVVAAKEHRNGSVAITLEVAGEAWWASLLLRLGPNAEVTKIDAGDRSEALEAAPLEMCRRVLARYGEPLDAERAVGRS